MGDSPLLNDIARFNDASTVASLQTAQTEAGNTTDVIMVELSVINALTSRSETDWFAAVGQLDSLIAEAEVLNRQGKFASLQLYPLNNAVYRYERLAACKFWKKIQSLNELSAHDK
jgi:hypothetical protein